MAAAAGAALLALNLAGIGRSERSEALSPALSERPGELLPPDVALSQASRRAGEPDSTYVRRLTGLVHRSMISFYPDLRRSPAFRFRVPATENYLLWSFAWLRPSTYRQYEYRVAERAIERGYGACSQFALATLDFLTRSGIRASLVSLADHVVVQAVDADGRHWMLDPDYGVSAPLSLAAIAANPESVRAPYVPLVGLGTRGIADSLPAAMQASFTSRPPRILGSISEPLSTIGAVYWLERLTYFLKWAIPVALLGWAALPLRSRWRAVPHRA